MDPAIIPAYGELAFHEMMSPDALYRMAAVINADLPEAAEIVEGYASTLADIRLLPVKEKVM